MRPDRIEPVTHGSDGKMVSAVDPRSDVDSGVETTRVDIDMSIDDWTRRQRDRTILYHIISTQLMPPYLILLILKLYSAWDLVSHAS